MGQELMVVALWGEKKTESGQKRNECFGFVAQIGCLCFSAIDVFLINCS